MSPLDSTTPDAATTLPKLYPPLPEGTPGQGGGTTGIKQRLRSAKEAVVHIHHGILLSHLKEFI